MNIDTGNIFQSFVLTPEEEAQAYQVNPYFLAMLQNKIAVYAREAATQQLPYDADPTRQVQAVLACQRMRNFVEAYQELMSEITAAIDPNRTQ